VIRAPCSQAGVPERGGIRRASAGSPARVSAPGPGAGETATAGSAAAAASVSRCSEDCQASPGYFDKNSACAEACYFRCKAQLSVGGVLAWRSPSLMTWGGGGDLRRLAWSAFRERYLAGRSVRPSGMGVRRAQSRWRRRLGRQRSLACVQVGLEEGGQRVEGDEVGSVVEVDVTGAGNGDQLLGFGGELVGLFAEFA
jgi:hypothetical protein